MISAELIRAIMAKIQKNLMVLLTLNTVKKNLSRLKLSNRRFALVKNTKAHKHSYDVWHLSSSREA